MANIKQLSPKEGVTLLAVKVPEGAYDFTLNYLNTGLLYGDDESEAPFPPLIRLPFECKLLGKTTEIPEEVLSELLEPAIKIISWDQYSDMPVTEKATPKEVWDNFLEANEVYRVNPLAFDPTGTTTSDWAHNEANSGTWVILLKTYNENT